MAAFDDVVIISGCRTPVGKFQGSLSDFTAPKLGAIAVREAVQRAKIDPKQVDECIMGNVVSAGLGQNPARQAAILRLARFTRAMAARTRGHARRQAGSARDGRDGSVRKAGGSIACFAHFGRDAFFAARASLEG